MGEVAKEAATFLRFSMLGGLAAWGLGQVWDTPGDWDAHTVFAVSSLVVYNVVWGVALVMLQFLEWGDGFARKAHQVPSMELQERSFKGGLVAHFTTVPMILLVLLPYAGGVGSAFTTAAQPGFLTAAYEIFTCHFLTEATFYVAHTLLHQPYFYATFHKTHHEYTGPIVISAEHSSLLESVANTLCTFAGIFYLGQIHLVSWLVFLTADMWGVYERHSGRDLSSTMLAKIGLLYPENALHHDRHHSINTGNYGHQLFDLLFGTMIPLK
eukprot:TRINITY_DN19652_c0_g1_i1.p1 TRINITY_DN19652_c0_g1~~TRINITY_DN19652_c0_g1_i1.p1  ORF type:complete len:298 (+),score=42.16 TRINITY_DN19652_c0_g1_i1:89-895(+)